MTETILQVVWFKRDLRLVDHAPLYSAAKSGLVLPLYIVEPDYWQLPDTSWRHWSFVRDSLIDLDQALRAQQARLIIKVGEVISVLMAIRSFYPKLVLWSHEETNNRWTYERDLRVKKWCDVHNVIWHELPHNGVVRRLSVQDNWAKCRAERMQQTPLPAPAKLHVATTIASDPLPTLSDALFGSETRRKMQMGGRTNGLNTLDSFLHERVNQYLFSISKPGPAQWYCSRLSPHLTYGTLSVREVEQALQRQITLLDGRGDKPSLDRKRNLNGFASRLIWREHFIQTFETDCKMEFACINPQYENMREPHHRDDFLLAWAQGQTGYPLVDACMRSLIERGWINFRMRSMLFSFASFVLWLDWRKTAPILARVFTDYEPGIHYPQCQIHAGTSNITLRIYNPIKQSQEQDPDGLFIKRFVPELRSVPTPFIHEPWLMPTPPANYPARLIDHETVLPWARGQLKLFSSK